ncbi:type I-B CRISPR-associated protein Cas8b/Csh1 [uncultured Draconibacterium sp.]|uniref:type I-B CRISPR-associated protein Cas8b/Csh1 n=1 Tax=uncultured Draconibacterium sp. TaxID=1573823 RepID=UPI0029C8DA3B|nr:type I-B CRISPR-associated protein Cas8b/Csh1 [uncultured Draconibacterium sp.]
MQDKAIAVIGEWQLEKNKGLEPVDLYIENMFSGKDYQMLLLLFEITNTKGELSCEYKGIDIEKVSAEKEGYRKYAYRKGSANGGDITFTTKLFIGKKAEIIDNIRKKLPKVIKRHTEIVKFKSKMERIHQEQEYFQLIGNTFSNNFFKIIREIISRFENFASKENTIAISTLIQMNGEALYLRDCHVVKSIILDSASETKFKRKSPNAQSKSINKVCSVTSKKETDIYGFAAPFSYSTPDKRGFLSGFFNIKNNWKNYPISSDSAIVLELGRKYIEENLSARFYGHDYLIVPNPILKVDKLPLEKIIGLLRSALIEQKNISKERKRRAEEFVMRTIAKEDNYFSLDIVFYKTAQASMKIQLHLEEQLPSRFNKLFIEKPEKVNKRKLFKNAIKENEEWKDLKFSFEIIKDFFEAHFLDNVNKIFRGQRFSINYLYDNIMLLIRNNNNKRKSQNGYVEQTRITVKKAIMLIAYLQELEIINYNKKYKYMDVETNLKKVSRFNLEGFNAFANENSNFLDSDIKVGIFAVGVLVRFLYDIQSQSLNTSNPPFENKLRGYKLNPELLMNVYTEALDKIQKYQKNNYVYTELREIVNGKFILKTHELNKMTNNELSFYFVAGLEMGKQFKREKKEN